MPFALVVLRLGIGAGGDKSLRYDRIVIECSSPM